MEREQKNVIAFSLILFLLYVSSTHFLEKEPRKEAKGCQVMVVFILI